MQEMITSSCMIERLFMPKKIVLFAITIYGQTPSRNVVT